MARQMRADRRRHTFGNWPFQAVDGGGVGWQSQYRQFIDQQIKKAAKRICCTGIGGGDLGFYLRSAAPMAAAASPGKAFDRQVLAVKRGPFLRSPP